MGWHDDESLGDEQSAQSGGSDPGTGGPSGGGRSHPRFDRPFVVELVGIAVAALVGVVLASIGLLDEPLAVILAATALLGLGFGAITAALGRGRGETERTRLLWLACGALALCAVGSVAVALTPIG